MAGHVSAALCLFPATVSGGGDAIHSRCGLWAGQGDQCPYSRGDGRAGGRGGNPSGVGGEAPAAGAGLEPAADRDGMGQLSSHGEPVDGGACGAALAGGVAARQRLLRPGGQSGGNSRNSSTGINDG